MSALSDRLEVSLDLALQVFQLSLEDLLLFYHRVGNERNRQGGGKSQAAEEQLTALGKAQGAQPQQS